MFEEPFGATLENTNSSEETFESIFENMYSSKQAFREILADIDIPEETLGEIFEDANISTETLEEIFDTIYSSEKTFSEVFKDINISKETLGEIFEDANISTETLGEIFKELFDSKNSGPPAQEDTDPPVSGENGGGVIAPLGNMQAVGDSILGFNQEDMLSIPDVVGRELGVSVINNAVGGAEFLGPEGIPTLYQSGSFSHVLVNGGGNDLSRDCSQATVDKIISADLRSGAMVDLVNRISSDGAQAVVMGYYLPRDGQIGCPLVQELMNRYQRLGQTRTDVQFVSTQNTITPNTPSLYFSTNDPVHPSPAGSEAIGQLIANQLQANSTEAGSLETGNTPIIVNTEEASLQGSSTSHNILQDDEHQDASPTNGNNNQPVGALNNDGIGGYSGDDTLGNNLTQMWDGSGDELLAGGLKNNVPTEDVFSDSSSIDAFLLKAREGFNIDFEAAVDFLGLSDGFSSGSRSTTHSKTDTFINFEDAIFAAASDLSIFSESDFSFG